MAAVKHPSRAAISNWVNETLEDVEVNSAPEKQCANGVLYCRLLDAVRPVRIGASHETRTQQYMFCSSATLTPLLPPLLPTSRCRAS